MEILLVGGGVASEGDPYEPAIVHVGDRVAGSIHQDDVGSARARADAGTLEQRRYRQRPAGPAQPHPPKAPWEHATFAAEPVSRERQQALQRTVDDIGWEQ